MRTPTVPRQIEFAAAIFLGAFLLFQVQPLLGKYILPWFGGSPAVWTVCLLFFQAVLFLGYAYAHATVRFWGPRPQVALHVALLVVAVGLLPIAPAACWKQPVEGNPSAYILWLLTACVGLPYFLLSSTSPLLQAWFSRVHPQQSPYRLYALSNFGSLLALVSYPFVVEPALNVQRQTLIWSWSFVAFAWLSGWAAWRVFRQPAGGVGGSTAPIAADAVSAVRPTWRTFGLWFALAMCPSVMLLATTDQLCVDVAVVPFLWVLPLTLYLVSFILCFHSPRWRQRIYWATAWAMAVSLAVPVMALGRNLQGNLPMAGQIAVYAFLLLCGAMVCHGELARLQPAPAYLTSFYLVLAAGGMAGGLFVALLAPLLFPQRVELSLAMVGCTVLVLWVLIRDPASRLYRGRPRWAWIGLALGLVLQTGALAIHYQSTVKGVEVIRRNFYGVLQIRPLMVLSEEPEMLYQLVHGQTLHGAQFAKVEKFRQPTSYYGPESGVGLVLHEHQRPLRVGAIGLGVGTVAAYGQEGDYFRFYEINPDVIDLAEHFFQYLPKCRARVEVILGDARLRLEQEPAQAFDVLVVDAFSSDAIPVHLLTQEAFEIYWKHLRPDGVLAVHISNRHLDLRPVVTAHASQDGIQLLSVRSVGQAPRGTRDALWCLLSREPTRLQGLAKRDSILPPERREVLWTDDRNSLFDVLIWNH